MIKKDNSRYNINFAKPVYVYKNLHKDCWSVKQDGLVKLHTNDITLYDCRFKVSVAGRERVLKEKRKNVHAGVHGYIENWVGGFDKLSWEEGHPTAEAVTYNPYKYKTFVFKGDKGSITASTAVKMKHNLVLADKSRWSS
jgi:hypothetical protein